MSKENDSDKEGFIDVLLIMMSLVLAGSSFMDGNGLFYLALFAFLTFTIYKRTIMTLKPMGDDDYSVYHKMDGLATFVMAITFPLVFVLYFYTKLFPTKEYNLLILIPLATITTAISALILISLVDDINGLIYIIDRVWSIPKKCVNKLKQRPNLTKIRGYFEKLIPNITEIVRYLQTDEIMKNWIKLSVVILVIDSVLLVIFIIWPNQPQECIFIKNASGLIDNASVTITTP